MGSGIAGMFGLKSFECIPRLLRYRLRQRIALSFWSSCIYFRDAGITDLYALTLVYGVLRTEPMLFQC